MINLLLGLYKNTIITTQNLTKKIFRIILVVGIIYFVIISFFNQTNKLYSHNNPDTKKTSIKQQRLLLYKKAGNVKGLNQKQKQSLILKKAIICSVTGELCTNKLDSVEKYHKNSVIGMATSLLTSPYINSPPASGIHYVYNTLDQAHLIPKTYAQQDGIGFATLYPFMDIWKVFRNFSFIIIVIIIIVIGFMIMFRMKLNSQTIITIENTLPKIIVLLILIEFSYAIAGFVIDTMYVFLALMIDIISKAGGFYDVVAVQKKFMNAGFGDIISILMGGADIPGVSDGFLNHASGVPILSSVKNIFFDLPHALIFVHPLIGIAITSVSQLVGLFIANAILNTPIFQTLTSIFNVDITTVPIVGAVTFIGGGLGGNFNIKEIIKLIFQVGLLGIISFMGLITLPLLIGAVIFFTIIVLFFRIFFMLISSYVKILLLIIFAPLIIFFGLIMGKNGFIVWLRNITTEIIVFPLIVIIGLLGVLITKTISTGTLPPLPFLMSLPSGPFGMIVGMALIFMIPELVKVFKQLVNPQAAPIPGIGPGIFFGGVLGGAAAALGTSQHLMGQAYYFKTFAPALPLGIQKFIPKFLGSTTGFTAGRSRGSAGAVVPPLTGGLGGATGHGADGLED